MSKLNSVNPAQSKIVLGKSLANWVILLLSVLSKKRKKRSKPIQNKLI